jgi:hypothetical protein
MKTAKVILIISAFAAPVLLHAQEKSTAPAQAKAQKLAGDALTPLETARKLTRIKGSRKIEIKPIKQTDGIKAGMVVAYGHLIPEPYKVEVVANKVLINGIQVSPSLVAERDVKPVQVPTDKKALSQQIYDLNREIKKKYYVQALFKDKKKLQSEILSYTKSQSIVEDARWGTDILFVKYIGDVGYSTMINLPGTTPEQPWPDKTKEAAEAVKQYITKGIKTGCVLIDSDGGITPGCGDKKIVRSVMSDTRLSKDEKIDRLAEWGNYESAMDMADNYIAQEWAEAGK